MNVPQVTELRRQLRAAKASYKVVKNTLARRALKGTSFEPLTPFFVGTTAVAYTSTDPVALAKTLTTFAKTAPMIVVKAAVVQGRAIKPAEVIELAALPGSPSSTPSCCSSCRRRWSRLSACSAQRHGFDECPRPGGEERRSVVKSVELFRESDEQWPK